MSLYRVTYLDGRTVDVPGDDAGVEGSGAIVVWRDVLVMSSPRRIVGWRFHPRDGVTSVDLVPDQP